MKYFKKKNKKGLKRDSKKISKKEVPLKERISALATKGFVIFFLLVIIGWAVFTYRLLYESDYFFIKENRLDWLDEPIVKKSYEKLLDTGRGENIFKFDISSAAAEMISANPELKSIQILRDFPDRLTLKVQPRMPVAQIGENEFFLIDDQGVVLTKSHGSIREDLPVITGIGWRLFREIGQKEESPRIAKALSLLCAIDESNFTDNHTLTKIDVSDYRNTLFFIEDGLEIKIGHSNFKERLELLDKTLASISMAKDEITYVDLRFDDVVLGTK